MYCKTFRTQLSPEGMEKFKLIVKEKYKPLISTQPGFKGAYFCTEDNNNFVMIMLWEEEQNLNDWTNNAGHEAIAAEMKKLYLNEVYVDFYKVIEEIL